MLKKILSLTLCLCVCLGVVFSATSCGSGGETSTTQSTGTIPTTLSFLGITSEVTDPDNVQMVEDELNAIFKARFKTKIELTLVTEDEYMDLVKERIEIAEYYKKYDDSIAKYNSYIKKQANNTATSDKIFGNWITNKVEINLETLATRLVYVAEQTTVYEDGKVETLYPEAPSPIDIVMIVDEEMYDDFDAMGLLLKDGIDPNLSTLKNLQKYIYPTFFSELKNLKGSVKAIPNNNMLAESTYLVVDKELADKYDFNIGTFKNYGDLADFLAAVKANEQIAPFKDVPEALGVFKLFSEDVAVGAYFDPLVGYNPAEGEQYASYKIQNLFEIPQYVDHLALMETYTKAGYFAKEYMANGYAVQVVTGDASIMAKYSTEDSKYEVKEIQIPFVLREAIFDGMLAPTAYSSDVNRAMEIIEAINTDPQIKNLLQYGVEEYNYIENKENGTVIRLNGGYMMDNALTGNVYMGLLEEGMGSTSWAYVKQTNLASAASPFLVFPVDEEYLQDNLGSILERAALAEALNAIGISYSEYANPVSSSEGVKMGNMLKTAYRDYFLQKLVEDNKATADSAASVIAGSSVNISWYESAIAAKIIEEKYFTIQTLEELDVLIGNKLSDGVVAYAIYEKARSKADKYVSNIESLEIITRITLFDDLTDAEFEKQYGSLTMTEFETAVYNYVRNNYIKENNITDEDYKELVEAFIASEFKFTNSNKQEYTYTWKDFEKIKENAAEFSVAVAKAKEVYMQDLLNNGYTAEYLATKNDVELADIIVDAIRATFYRNELVSASAYQKAIYDTVILEPFGVTKDQLDKMKTTDNAGYKEILKKVKAHYKKILLETYTKAEYEALAENKVLPAVLDYYIEFYTQANAGICEAMGYSKEEYKEYYGYMEEYVKCVKKIRTSFIYTLRTIYDQSYIDSWTVTEAETAVYNAVYESGYYMNEVAKCIGISLSDYNSNKSDATEYLGYLTKLIDLYANKLTAKGYNVAEVKTYNPNDVEEIIRDIIKEEDFSAYKTIDVVLAEMCKDAINGISSAKDVLTYCQNQAKALSGNYLYDAVVGYLNEDLQKKLAAAK